MAWLTLAKTPASIRSAIILKGFCLSCSARSRTTIGGLIEMTWASAGGQHGVGFGSCRRFGLRRRPLPPKRRARLGARASEKPRVSPRLGIPLCPSRAGLAGALLSRPCHRVQAPGLGGNWIKPTLSPTSAQPALEVAGGGGGGALHGRFRLGRPAAAGGGSGAASGLTTGSTTGVGGGCLLDSFNRGVSSGAAGTDRCDGSGWGRTRHGADVRLRRIGTEPVPVSRLGSGARSNRAAASRWRLRRRWRCRLG